MHPFHSHASNHMADETRNPPGVDVSPDAVAAPRDRRAIITLRPEHLYKAVGLFFLFSFVFEYLTAITTTLLLLFAASILAILLNEIVGRLPGRKWMTALVGLLIFAGIGAALYFGIPAVIAQIRDLTGRIPEFEQQLQQAETWIRENTGLNVQLVGPEAQRYFRNAVAGTSGGGDKLLSRATSVIGLLFVPLLILFGGLFAVANPNDRLLTPLLRLVPADRRPAFRRIFELLGLRLMGWLKGVLISMVAVGALSVALYWLIGVPNALLLGIFAGLTEAIPLIGPWIGGAVATGVAFLDDPDKAVWTAFAALAIQQFENNILVPWAMSKAADIHPFVTLFALVLFGSLFGFLGVLLSIPLVMVVSTVVQVLWVERAIDTDEDSIEPVVEE